VQQAVADGFRFTLIVPSLRLVGVVEPIHDEDISLAASCWLARLPLYAAFTLAMEDIAEAVDARDVNLNSGVI
jgi:hypothetical protein